MANLQFFQQIHKATGKKVLLEHMDPAFVEAMVSKYGFTKDTSMENILLWSLEQVDASLTHNTVLELQQKIETLDLPRKMVMLDVNGTLFPDESKDGYIDIAKIVLLKEKINQLSQKGITVGMCSDSPIEPLVTLATTLGITGPIIAENGNVMHYRNKTSIVNPLGSLKDFQAQIQQLSDGFTQLPDVVAPELGGSNPDFSFGQWAFGKGRQASISVFGPVELIQQLGKKFAGIPGISVDCSPEYHFFAIHPGEYKKNKGNTLSQLVTFGHQVVMVGNSSSDWVDPDSGVECAFVGSSRISPEVASLAAFVSKQTTIDGVLDILDKVLEKQGKVI